MPYAVTHALIPIILVDTVRDHVFKMKRSFLPNRYVLLAGIAGMLPDLDLLFFLMLFVGFSLHILMDAVLLGSVVPLFPLDSTEIGFNILAPIEALGPAVFPAIDAILLFVWLIHEELEDNIG